MKKVSIIILSMIVFAAMINGCQKTEEKKVAQKPPEPPAPEVKEVPAVCIWDQASVRADASAKAKWISAMALGEKVTWLGEEKVDSSSKNRRYLHIRLSDGTEGWASEYVIATDAKPAVVYKEAPIYRRPDLLTVTESVFDPMEIVAIVGNDGDWIDVIGAENKKKGWIQSKLVSKNETDVAVALLTSKALAEKNEEKRKEKLQDIIDNTAFAGSIFLEDIELKLAEMQPEEPEMQVADSVDSMIE
jgi:hypothetical protein